MNDYMEELEKSYNMMGDGIHDTDELLAWERAKELLESKEPVTLNIVESLKGGVAVEFEGIRGFIPISRLSLEHIEDTKSFLYKDITVQAIEVNMDEDKLVFSAKELLKEQETAKLRKKIEDVKVGSIVTGTVRTLKEYGAFVDIKDGLSGLVHISQISNKRIKHPGVVLEEGQEVKAKIIDVKDGKISLSMKVLEEEIEEEEGKEEINLPESEDIGTSMASLLKGFKLS